MGAKNKSAEIVSYANNIRENLRNLKLAVESEDWDVVVTFAEAIKEDAGEIQEMPQVPEIPKELEPLREAIEAVVDAENDCSPALLEETLTELGGRLMALLRKK